MNNYRDFLIGPQLQVTKMEYEMNPTRWEESAERHLASVIASLVRGKG